MSFTKKPRMKAYDMVVINVSDDEVITSPHVSINQNTWISKGFENGIYEIEYDGTSWKRKDAGTAFNLASNGITVSYPIITSEKTGDTITVEQSSNEAQSGETEYTVNVSLTRTGNVLETDNPFATQQIADDMLAKVIGYAYQPYEASGAIINPAAELGDAITAYGLYGGLYSEELTFSRLMMPGIGAPGDADTNHEFGYVEPNERKYKRQFSKMQSELTIHASQIAAKVSKVGGNQSFSWQLESDHFSVLSGSTEMLHIDQYGSTFGGTIYADSIKRRNGGEWITGSQIKSATITGGSGGNIGNGTITGGNIGSRTVTTGNTSFGDDHASSISSINGTVQALINGSLTISAIRAYNGSFPNGLAVLGYDVHWEGKYLCRDI